MTSRRDAGSEERAQDLESISQTLGNEMISETFIDSLKCDNTVI